MRKACWSTYYSRLYLHAGKLRRGEYSDVWAADHSQSRDLCRQQSLLERTGGETVDGDAQSCRRRIMRRLLAAERCSPIRWAADTRVKLGRLECLAEEDMLLMNHLVKRLESALIRQAVSLVEGSSCVWYRRAATQEAMPFRAPATRRHPAMAGGCASRLAVRRCSVALQRKVAGLLRAMNESCT